MDLQQMQLTIDRIHQPTLPGHSQHEWRAAVGNAACLLSELVLNSGGLQNRRRAGIGSIVFGDAVRPVQAIPNLSLEASQSL
jgi:hypothetical protein